MSELVERLRVRVGLGLAGEVEAAALERIEELERALGALIRECEEGDFDGVNFEHWCGEKPLREARAVLEKRR